MGTKQKVVYRARGPWNAHTYRTAAADNERKRTNHASRSLMKMEMEWVQLFSRLLEWTVLEYICYTLIRSPSAIADDRHSWERRAFAVNGNLNRIEWTNEQQRYIYIYIDSIFDAGDAGRPPAYCKCIGKTSVVLICVPSGMSEIKRLLKPMGMTCLRLLPPAHLCAVRNEMKTRSVTYFPSRLVSLLFKF